MSHSDADFPSDLRALDREYELIRELRQGGMAAVYLARNRQTGRLVAIKSIRSRYLDDADAVQRFAREARTVAGLEHPNIVRTEAIEQIGDRAVAIIMEHVPGGTVRDWLREHGSLGAEHAEGILRDVASALGYAHRRGIVHRDVKPENIFLDAQHGRALLSDFGIARQIDGDAGITLLGAALGTPQYMSPEQIDGQLVDGRSDIYSLGVLGWELLTGRRPWAGESLYGVIYKQKHEDLPRITSLRPRVPANLLFAIERALVKDKKLRWQNTEDFLDQLTYNPPPVLEQTFPPRALRADDQPTVRFRALSLVRDDEPPVANLRAHDAGAPDIAPTDEPHSAVRTPSAQLPVAEFAATDDAFRETDERAVLRTPSAAPDEFTLPMFEPNEGQSFAFSSRRIRIAQVAGLVVPLGIAAGALFIVLGGSPDDSAPGARRSTSVSSAGSVAPDSQVAQPVTAVPGVGDPAGMFAARLPAASTGVVAGSSVSSGSEGPAAAPTRRPDSPLKSTRSGPSTTAVSAAPGSRTSRPRGDSSGAMGPALTVIASNEPRAVPPKDESAAASRGAAAPAIEDPFKIPPPSSGPPAPAASTPALGGRGSGPSPRCRIAAAADQRACLDAYIVAGDAPLTQAFDALVGELRRLAGTPTGAPDPPTVQRVRVEQRAWFSVRNGECPREARAGAGPFWAREQSECFTEMATSRTAELRDAVRRLKRR